MSTCSYFQILKIALALRARAAFSFFEKFTRVCQHLIALKIMFLPIQIMLQPSWDAIKHQ